MSNLISKIDLLHLMPDIGRFDKIEQYRKFIKFMKSSENLEELNFSNLISENADVILLPICNANDLDETTIELLTKWRNLNLHAFESKEKVTYDSTKSWLQQLRINPNRILFFVYGASPSPIGHIGFNLYENNLEIDNVVRGETTNPGIMHKALQLLEQFAAEHLNQEVIRLRVITENHSAKNWYIRNGYQISDSNDMYTSMIKNLQINKPKDVETILMAGPSISIYEKSFAKDATSNGWNVHHSDYLTKFETSFANYVGSEFAIATSSCTGALHLSLLASGIGPGDEVIVPNITWVATASAVRYVGAIPVFADVNPISWTIDLESIKRLITSHTKAIIPVHIYGYACEIHDIANFAKERNLIVIEDAAPAIGTLYEGRAAGTFGDIGCYSFQGAKMLVTGEGGMLVTNDRDLFLKAKKLQDHGRKPGTFWIEELGYKYKLSNTSAAVGLGQLITSERQIDKKTQINSWYHEKLLGIPFIEFQEPIPNSRSIHWMTSVKIKGIQRDKLFQYLSSVGIDTRPTFPPISRYPFWGKTLRTEDEISNEIGDFGVNLPSGVRLNRLDIYKVSDEILKFCENQL